MCAGAASDAGDSRDRRGMIALDAILSDMSNEAKALAGRRAIVTGASAGIGEACVRRLAALGAMVVVNARRRERLESLIGEIERAGGRAAPVAGDCCADDVIERMLDAAEGILGEDGRDARPTDQTTHGADLVVINAGRGLAGSVLTSDPSQWEAMTRTNLIAAAKLLRASAERMLRRSEVLTEQPRDIVIIGSNVGKNVSPFSSMYGATKFAVGALAEGARRELGPKGIRVTLICPGIVTTEFQHVAGYSDELLGSFRERFDPLLTGDDIARLVAFIASQPAHVHVNDVMIRPTRQDYP